jgi:hypothetical protein
MVADMQTITEDLVAALRDISAHSRPPFTTDKWFNYIREVADDALTQHENANDK